MSGGMKITCCIKQNEQYPQKYWQKGIKYVCLVTVQSDGNQLLLPRIFLQCDQAHPSHRLVQLPVIDEFCVP